MGTHDPKRHEKVIGMTAVSIHKEIDGASGCFRAVAGSHQSLGRTPGEALDSLLADEKLGVDSSMILIQRFVPDSYFTQAQYDQMKALLDRRDSLTPEENAQLDSLIDAELEATISRSQSLSNRMKP